MICLDPPLEGCGEIKFFHKALQELLGGLPYIDPASFKPGQLQRLLGTRNFKRGGVQTDILEEREAEPLDPHILIKEYLSGRRVQVSVGKPRRSQEVQEPRTRTEGGPQEGPP
ncbi:MAG: hypothetical protein Q9N34_06860 [Aquificota bacterium]|nr:hypothetical protein [Aquificota bacterium]